MSEADRVHWSKAIGWSISSTASQGRRRGLLEEDPFVTRLRQAGLLTSKRSQEIFLEADLVGRPRPRRGLEPEPTFELLVDREPGESFVALVRTTSGALTIVPGEALDREDRRSSEGTAKRTLRFRIRVGLGESTGALARRGLAGKVVRILIWRVLDRQADRSLEKLARRWEKGAWDRSGKHLGWISVSREGLSRGRLEAVDRWNNLLGERNLLLLHGTFSSAEGAFRYLADTAGSDGRNLFDAVGHLYGDRVFAFNHLSVGDSPSENARALLAGLPTEPTKFDVLTHSRGGLVLRHLVERKSDFGNLAERLTLGRVVLVAAPNEGTALASPRRWQETVGWFANLLDMFPENGLTFGLQFVSEGLTWIARRAIGELSGLAAMDPASPDIASLQGSPNAPIEAYSALVSNFEPGPLWARLLDSGTDAFFSSANDLVVPTEGGWQVGDPTRIPGERIGCFGPGGNLRAEEPVHHTGFFRQPAAITFLVRALTGESQEASLNPAVPLPFRRRLRSSPIGTTDESPRPSQQETKAAPQQLPPSRDPVELLNKDLQADTLHLFIMDPREQEEREADEGRAKGLEVARILAIYRNARVLADFRLRKHDAGKRFQQIIAQQRAIRAYIDGEPSAKNLPNESELRSLGRRLFECLFPGDVRRLYDSARTTRDGHRLDIVLTSMIHWVADLPWEFAFDPGRKTFLATEEINFVRNVATAIPAEEVFGGSGALHILVVAAQPVGWGKLSAKEEIQLVGRGFQLLSEAGLIQFEVIRSISPEILHKRLELAQIRGERFDVLHFIGHGEYDEKNDVGYLLFEDGNSGSTRLSTDQVRQIACRRGIKILFLNACETGSGGRSDFNRGVAQGLVAGGVPVVVGNQYKVLDPSATTFAQHFYWALAHGSTVGDAAREARIAVSYSIHGEAIDWAVPVIFAQNPRETLCKPLPSAIADQQVEPFEIFPQGPSRRHTDQRAALRIGLWDVNNALPQLKEVASRLNQVQTYFFFAVVELSAPIGTWRLVRRPGKSFQGYVFAENVIEKLGTKPREMGLRKLLCFTTFPLGDENFLNLYSADLDPRDEIAVFSFAGFEGDFSKPGFSLERAIANLVSGSLTKLDPHLSGTKTCPCYFNGEKDPRFVAAPLALCEDCENDLEKLIKRGEVSADEVAAAKALLDAYPKR